MPHYNFNEAHAAQAALREFIADYPVGSQDADETGLQIVRRFCRKMLNGANDSTCIAIVDRIEDWAAALFSAEKRADWDHPGQPGTAHLRIKLRILQEVIAFRVHISRVCETQRLSPVPATSIESGKAIGVPHKYAA
jgi:hypothetical protein